MVDLLNLEKNITACDRFFPAKEMHYQQQVHVPRFNFTAFKDVELM